MPLASIHASRCATGWIRTPRFTAISCPSPAESDLLRLIRMRSRPLSGSNRPLRGRPLRCAGRLRQSTDSKARRPSCPRACPGNAPACPSAYPRRWVAVRSDGIIGRHRKRYRQNFMSRYIVTSQQQVYRLGRRGWVCLCWDASNAIPAASNSSLCWLRHSEPDTSQTATEPLTLTARMLSTSKSGIITKPTAGIELVSPADSVHGIKHGDGQHHHEALPRRDRRRVAYSFICRRCEQAARQRWSLSSFMVRRAGCSPRLGISFA